MRHCNICAPMQSFVRGLADTCMRFIKKFTDKNGIFPLIYILHTRAQARKTCAALTRRRLNAPLSDISKFL